MNTGLALTVTPLIRFSTFAFIVSPLLLFFVCYVEQTTCHLLQSLELIRMPGAVVLFHFELAESGVKKPNSSRDAGYLQINANNLIQLGIFQIWIKSSKRVNNTDIELSCDRHRWGKPTSPVTETGNCRIFDDVV